MDEVGVTTQRHHAVPSVEAAAPTRSARSLASHGIPRSCAVLPNPYGPLTVAKLIALKATVLPLITLVIKAGIGVTALSALGMVHLASRQPRPAAA